MDLKASRVSAIQYLLVSVNTELRRNTMTNNLALDFLWFRLVDLSTIRFTGFSK